MKIYACFCRCSYPIQIDNKVLNKINVAVKILSCMAITMTKYNKNIMKSWLIIHSETKQSRAINLPLCNSPLNDDYLQDKNN